MQALQAAIDHLAVTASDLEAATAHVEDALGLSLFPGGRHETMGTWNRLLGLGPGCYLEAIAPEPGAPAPPHPRWFRMDEMEADGRGGRPRLTNWILRVGDLDTALSVAPSGAGRATGLSRGDLRWRIGIPPDGRLPFDDAFPALIEWEGSAHPSMRLEDVGCRLVALEIEHPRAEALEAALAPFRPLPAVRVGSAAAVRLRAEIATPHGRRTLE